MTTYTIVSEDKDPLGPNEINAGGTIQVNDGDIFIIDPTADESTEFEAASGSSTDFEVRFAQSNGNTLTFEFEDDLNPTITISDDVDLAGTNLKADDADSVTLNAGDRVTLGKYSGSKNGVDTFTAGDDFTMITEINTRGGDDVIRIGANAAIDKIDGGKGTDSLFTQTDLDDLGVKNIENINIVCFGAGTRIATLSGPVAVEDLRIGDMVMTLDHGAQPIRWIGSRKLGAAELLSRPKLRPIRILAGALGNGFPSRDLVVSPQHRVLVRSRIAQRIFAVSEVLIPAIKLIGIDGISVIEAARGVTYFHLLLDRHEILFSEDAATESLYLGPQALAGLAPEAVAEIGALFPDMTDNPAGIAAPARLIPATGRQMKSLAQRHCKNRKALIGAPV